MLSYSKNSQALSSYTSQEINGTEPYLTFDNGVTKVTTSEGLLGITLSDGTRITPATNTSTNDNPIELPVANQRFTDIAMLVPATANSIDLSTLIGPPYNYWGDDDGDGQGVNGITATGNLMVSIKDRVGNSVSRGTVLSICGSPYRVILTSTNGSLITQYGAPNSSSFKGSTVTYYISPKAAEPAICYARPNTQNGTYDFAGPATIWSRYRGFLVQSSESESYSRNFPTTGANNLHFDFLVRGIDAATLTWPSVTQGGITATMTLNPPKDPKFNDDGESSVRVTLTGPVATSAQQSSRSPDSVATPILPQTFELVGYDSNNKAVLKYGFILKQWFVSRGNIQDRGESQISWCTNLGGGYRLPQIKDLTNAKSFLGGGAKPLSKGNYYQRNIGAGFVTEWGNLDGYTAAGFAGAKDYYWTSSGTVRNQNYMSQDGGVGEIPPNYRFNAVCVYP